MYISIKMNESFNVGWWPEDSVDPLDEEFDIQIKQSRKLAHKNPCKSQRRMLGLRTR